MVREVASCRVSTLRTGPGRLKYGVYISSRCWAEPRSARRVALSSLLAPNPIKGVTAMAPVGRGAPAKV